MTFSSRLLGLTFLLIATLSLVLFYKLRCEIMWYNNIWWLWDAAAVVGLYLHGLCVVHFAGWAWRCDLEVFIRYNDLHLRPGVHPGPPGEHSHFPYDHRARCYNQILTYLGIVTMQVFWLDYFKLFYVVCEIEIKIREGKTSCMHILLLFCFNLYCLLLLGFCLKLKNKIFYVKKLRDTNSRS